MRRPDFASEFVDFVRSVPGIRERAESLCRSLSPEEFANEPIYVSLQSDAPEELRSIEGCSAWAEGNFGDRLLGRPGYRGAGHGIVLCDLRQGEWFDRSLRQAQVLTADGASEPGLPALFPYLAKQFLEMMLGPSLMHEFVHVVVFGKPVEGSRPCDRQIVDRNCGLAQWLTTGLDEVSKRLPWYGHGHSFIRGQLHLHYRLKAQLADVRTFDARLGEWETTRYGLSPMDDYAAALGNEPERMWERPLREILASNAPAEFTMRFGQDVLNFEAKRDAAAGI